MIGAGASVWFSTLGAVLAVSLISLAGILALVAREAFLRRALPFLVSFAVGALLGDALLHILPELAKVEEGELGQEGGFTTGIAFVIVGAIVFFFVLEKAIHVHHTLDAPEHRHIHPVAVNNLIGDGVHNFVDGAIIAGAFIVDARLGVGATAAVMLHEIPQEVGDLGVLVHAGLTPRRAVVYNLASALVALFGAVLALVLEGVVDGLERPLLATSAGAFIYIAGADLIPELHRTNDWRSSIVQFVGIVGGFAVMALLLLAE
ncbi:MAG TPA: ZIP family metal transporter [Actinomycetota bacterium]|nr:ZIP family metal transporter [Actinomycetota bacterium]